MKINKYGSSSALLRYFSALCAIVAFILLFGKIIAVNGSGYLRFSAVFFNKDDVCGTPYVLGFIGQLFILFGGLAGLAIVFFNFFEGKEKVSSFIVAAVLIVFGVLTLLTKILFVSVCDVFNPNNFANSGQVIAAGVLAIVAGVGNYAAAFIKE